MTTEAERIAINEVCDARGVGDDRLRRNLYRIIAEQRERAVEEATRELREKIHEAVSERDRLKAQVENLLKPQRDKLAEERDQWRKCAKRLADRVAAKQVGDRQDEDRQALAEYYIGLCACQPETKP